MGGEEAWSLWGVLSGGMEPSRCECRGVPSQETLWCDRLWGLPAFSCLWVLLLETLMALWHCHKCRYEGMSLVGPCDMY